MRKSILINLDFLLGVQKTWDSYYEVIVQFTKETTINGYKYHIFTEKDNKNSYYLRPRYSGQQIEGVLIEKRIVVSISERDRNKNNKSPVTYATGLLQCNDKK
jgi:hypothetical protein